MLKLKAMLPEKRYKNAKQAEKLPEVRKNPSSVSVLTDDKSVRQSLVIGQNNNKPKE
jgi:hypothetical protein